MGTDIHMRAEIRPAPKAPWEAVGSIFPNPYYNPVAEAKIKLKRASEGKEDDGYVSLWGSPTTPEPYGRRNYTLFAALSNVRNGFGFAGVPTGKPIPPSVAAGRGLPADLARHWDEESYRDRLQYDEWYGGAPADLSNAKLAEELFIFGEHSQGWITLAELLDYDWDYEVTHYGVVGAREFRRCIEQDVEPRSWCGDISGGAVQIISAAEACAAIEHGEFPPAAGDNDGIDVIEGHNAAATSGISYHVRHEWTHPLREDVQEFLDVIDKMRHWGNDYKLWHRDGPGTRNPKATMHDPNCIRLVFGYDS